MTPCLLTRDYNIHRCKTGFLKILMFRTTGLMNRSLTILLCLFGFSSLLLVYCDNKSGVLEAHSTFDYYESSRPGVGARNLILRPDGSLELYTFRDTIAGALTAAETQQIKAGLPALEWEQSYNSSRDPQFRRLTRRHPEGVRSITLYHGSEAPEAVRTVLEILHSVVERLAAEAQAAEPQAGGLRVGKKKHPQHHSPIYCGSGIRSIDVFVPNSKAAGDRQEATGKAEPIASLPASSASPSSHSASIDIRVSNRRQD